MTYNNNITDIKEKLKLIEDILVRMNPIQFKSLLLHAGLSSTDEAAIHTLYQGERLDLARAAKQLYISKSKLSRDKARILQTLLLNSYDKIMTTFDYY